MGRKIGILVLAALFRSKKEENPVWIGEALSTSQNSDLCEMINYFWLLHLNILAKILLKVLYRTYMRMIHVLKNTLINNAYLIVE